MKKTLSLFLLFLFTLTLTSCGSNAPQWAEIPLTSPENEESAPIQGSPVAVAVSTDNPVGGVEFSSKITGEHPQITVAIYKANKDYKTTLSEKPVRKETFDNLSEKLLWQFRTLPAGDYLILFSDEKDGALLKEIVPSDEANGKILNYRNGEIMTDGVCKISLLCIKTEANPEPGLTTFAYPVPEE